MPVSTLKRVCAGIAACLLVVTLAAPAVAQLSSEDIEALRKQAAREGWSFTVGENGATARSLDQLCGLVKPDGWEDPEPVELDFPARTLPMAYDWRNPVGGAPLGVTPIKDQDGCGSCWAFSAIGAMECAIRIRDGVDVDLSEQWLVSCTGSGDCGGGWPSMALSYMTCAGGNTDDCGDSWAVLEADFPYVAWNAPCGCPYVHPYCIDSYLAVPNNITAIKNAIYNYGPVSTTVYVDSAFQAYNGGIFDACSYGPLNHAVVLVGWSDYDGYWIMRNSWGTDWGEDGYMRIQYGCSRIGENTILVQYSSDDCNTNGVPDRVDVVYATSPDCNGNFVPDECEPDCNTNGVPDICDLWAGTSPDCNRNNLPDECDIASATSADCNTNAIPDECDLETTFSFDCNLNDIPDECELALPDADCNANGALDDCDVSSTFYARSSQLSPIGYGSPQTYVVDAPRTALGDVTIRVTARGDFNFSSEYLDVFMNGTWVGALLDSGAFDCPAVPNEDTLVVPASQFNDALATGSVAIDLVATEQVEANKCTPYTWVIVDVSYPAPPISTDCNNNATPDECDIAGGYSQDTNQNGIPDECEAIADCRGDCNCDGAVTFGDIQYFVAALGGYQSWVSYHVADSGGPPTCPYANCDANGVGGCTFDDIQPFVALIGNPCTR